jgi:regulator of extracellular matrix RemA (YlzA/DUF370 family)
VLEYIVAAEWALAGLLLTGATLLRIAKHERDRKRSFDAMYGRYVLARRKDDEDYCVVYDYSAVWAEAKAKRAANRAAKFNAIVLPFKRK